MTDDGPGTVPFEVNDECHRLDLRAGAIVFRDVTVQPSSSALRDEIQAAAQRIQNEFSSAADIRALPELAKLHEIFRSVGVKPREHPPSTDSLLRYALKRGDLPSINNLVDTYNLVSIRTRLSLGAHDVDRLTLPVRLQVFPHEKAFVPLGNTEEQIVGAGEFGYIDAADRVLCRLDARQADFSKVTATTQNVLLIVEGTVTHGAALLSEAMAEVERNVLKQCGGSVQWRSEAP